MDTFISMAELDNGEWTIGIVHGPLAAQERWTRREAHMLLRNHA